jgi:hypothetical protein
MPSTVASFQPPPAAAENAPDNAQDNARDNAPDNAPDNVMGNALDNALDNAPAERAPLDVSTAITAIQSLALAFHVSRFDGDAPTDDDKRALYELRSDDDFNDFRHVRMQAEYVFDGPVREYLDGAPDPFEVTDEKEPDGPRAAATWFRYRPSSLASCTNLPQYIERLTTLWLRYARLAAPRLGETWIDMRAHPSWVIEAIQLHLSGLAVQRGAEHRSMFAPEVTDEREREYFWSVRADHYVDAASRLCAILLPALYSERDRRRSTHSA